MPQDSRGGGIYPQDSRGVVNNPNNPTYLRHCSKSNHFKEGDISQRKTPSLKKNATPLHLTLVENKIELTVLFKL